MNRPSDRSDLEFHPSNNVGERQTGEEQQGDLKAQGTYADDSSTSVTAPPTVSSAGPTVLSSASSMPDVAQSSSSFSHVDEPVTSSWTGVDPSSPWASRRRHLAGVLSTVVPGYGAPASIRDPLTLSLSKHSDSGTDPVELVGATAAETGTMEGATEDQLPSTHPMHSSNGERQPFSRSASTSFARLVQGWEATISSLGRESRAAQPVETAEKFEPLQLLEHLSLGCGPRDDFPTDEGVELHIDRINWRSPAESAGGQPNLVSLHPNALKHVQHSPMRTAKHDSDCDVGDADDDEDDSRWTEPSISMERSLSVPSEFRHSVASSAFSQPDHRRSYGAMSDPGVYNSAFEPVLAVASFQRSYSTAVCAEGTAEKNGASFVSTPTHSTPPRESDHPKYLFVFNDGRRRRKKRSGRENPARPPSTSSSSRDTDDDSLRRGRGTSNWRPLSDDGSSSLEAHLSRGAFLATDGDETAISSQPSDELRMERRRHHLNMCSSNESDDGMSNDEYRADFPATSTLFQYHPMEDDEEIAPIDEAAAAPVSPPLPPTNSFFFCHGLGETSTPIPSLAYQPMSDCEAKEDDPPEEFSARSARPQLMLARRSVVGLSPNSYDSGSVPLDLQSVNTSSQTHATTTSGTVSSAPTVSSSVTDADNEVKEANRRKTRRRERSTADSTESYSCQSASSSSTRPLAYFASPGPLREGANLPVDRFFAGTVSQGSSPVAENTLRNGLTADGPKGVVARRSPSVRSGSGRGSIGSPEVYSSQLLGNSSSPFVTEDGAARVSPASICRSPSRTEHQQDGVAEERDSPAVIVGSTRMALEVRSMAPSQYPKPIRPNSWRLPAKAAQTDIAYKGVRVGAKIVPSKGAVGKSTKRATSEVMGSIQLSPEINASSASSASSVGTPTSPPPQIIESRAPDDLQKMGAARPNVLRKHVDLKGASGKLVLVSPEICSDPTIFKTSSVRRLVTKNLRPVTPDNMGSTITSIEEETGEIPMRPCARRKDPASSSRETNFGPEMTSKGSSVVTPEK